MAGVVAPVVRRGKASETRFQAALVGGPELRAKLVALDEKIRKKVAADALRAGGRIIADEWSRRVPVGQPPEDPHPGAYRRSLEQEDAVKVGGTKTGALGSVRPGRVDGIDDGDQPRVYAARLEFVTSVPSARPAFDSSKGAAVEAISDELRDALDPRRIA